MLGRYISYPFPFPPWIPHLQCDIALLERAGWVCMCLWVAPSPPFPFRESKGPGLACNEQKDQTFSFPFFYYYYSFSSLTSAVHVL